MFSSAGGDFAKNLERAALRSPPLRAGAAAEGPGGGDARGSRSALLARGGVGSSSLSHGTLSLHFLSVLRSINVHPRIPESLQ